MKTNKSHESNYIHPKIPIETKKNYIVNIVAFILSESLQQGLFLVSECHSNL